MKTGIENHEEKTANRKGFLQNEFVIFFFGPPLFLILVKFTGYSIFYDPDTSKNSRKKFIMLLSAGSAFYLTLIIVLFILGS